MRISKEFKTLVPYVPGKPIAETQREYGLKEVVKLASNESPFGPSEGVIAAIQKAARETHRYPDSACYELREKCAKYYGAPPQQIAFGNGSNELIDLLIRAFCEPGDAILTSDKAFIAYRISAQAARVRVIETPMTRDYRFDVHALKETLKTAQKNRIKVVFLSNPNNPTGTYINQTELEEILAAVENPEETLVVLDEAYLEFVRAKDFPNSLKLLSQHPNVALLRTFSKAFGLAGLRLGSLIAWPDVIDIVQRLRNPFNVNHFVQEAAMVALDEKERLKQVLEMTWAGLDQLEKGLSQLGFEVVPSQGNFIFFDSFRSSAELSEALLRKGVIVRPLRNYGFMSQIRVTAGLPQENQKFLESLRQILPSVKEITA